MYMCPKQTAGSYVVQPTKYQTISLHGPMGPHGTKPAAGRRRRTANGGRRAAGRPSAEPGGGRSPGGARRAPPRAGGFDGSDDDASSARTCAPQVAQCSAWPGPAMRRASVSWCAAVDGAHRGVLRRCRGHCVEATHRVRRRALGGASERGAVGGKARLLSVELGQGPPDL